MKRNNKRWDAEIPGRNDAVRSSDAGQGMLPAIARVPPETIVM